MGGLVGSALQEERLFRAEPHFFLVLLCVDQC